MTNTLQKIIERLESVRTAIKSAKRKSKCLIAHDMKQLENHIISEELDPIIPMHHWMQLPICINTEGKLCVHPREYG